MAIIPDKTGTVDTRALADGDDAMGGTGGSAGGGTLAGGGEPSGGRLERDAGLPEASNDEVAREAAALGPADGALADAAGVSGGSGTGLGEAVGSGAGRADTGSGTPADRGGLGGSTPAS